MVRNHRSPQEKLFLCKKLLIEKRSTAERMVPSCSARQHASNDMRFNLFSPNLTLRSRDLRSTFGLDISGSKHTFLDSSRLEKLDGAVVFKLD